MGGSKGGWSRKPIEKLEEQARREIRDAAKIRGIAGGEKFDKGIQVEESCVDSRGDIWIIFKSKTDQWGWRCSPKDSREPDFSETGYESRNECIDAARRRGMDCDPR